LLKASALSRLSFFPHCLSDPIKFASHLFVRCGYVVEGVSDLAFQANPRNRQANRKIAVSHGLKACKDEGKTVRLKWWVVVYCRDAILAVFWRPCFFISSYRGSGGRRHKSESPIGSTSQIQHFRPFTDPIIQQK
jgi:hypothetical protein